MKRITGITSTVLLYTIAFGTSLAQIETPADLDSLSTTESVNDRYAVELTTSFENVRNLSVINLGLSSSEIDVGDGALLGRLPSPVSISAAFPVKIDIDPMVLPGGGLQFDGVARVTLVTEHLPYTVGTRLRLFSAHDGGPFIDITEHVSEGSYRVRGSRGEFSEFLIARDDRAPATVVATKLARLDALLTTHAAAIDTTMLEQLRTQLATTQQHWQANDTDAAMLELQAFEMQVRNASALPATWQAGSELVNVSGLLRAAAATLLFSLDHARDSDGDGTLDFGDNCLLVANATQCDSDANGIGNACDGDIDGNGLVNSFDLGALRSQFGTVGPSAADLDCNGIVNSFDLNILRTRFGQAPGPAAAQP